MKFGRIWSSLVLLLLCCASCTPSRDISGAWSGTLDTGHLKLRLVLHLKHAANGYKGTVDLIDQGRKNVRVSGVKVSHRNIHFTISGLAAVYDANINTNTMAMTGTFRQSGASIPLTLTKTPNPPQVPEPLTPAAYTPHDGSDLQGYWTGTVSNFNVATRVAFKISEPSDGKFLGELDNIDQGVTGIPVTSISYQLRNVHINVVGVGATFDGTLSSASGEMTGTWKQGPNTTALTLNRTSPPVNKP